MTKVFIKAQMGGKISARDSRWDEVLAILESVLVTFGITMIPALIELGHVPTCIDDVYIPLLSSLLMAMYTYIRIRSLDVGEE